VAGGRVPTSAWMLNLPILTSGGSQGAPAPPHHEIRGHVDLAVDEGNKMLVEVFSIMREPGTGGNFRPDWGEVFRYTRRHAVLTRQLLLQTRQVFSVL